MRCRCCDKILSPSEMKRKNATTKEFDDLCNHCVFMSTDEAYPSDHQHVLQNLTDDLAHQFGFSINK